MGHHIGDRRGRGGEKTGKPMTIPVTDEMAAAINGAASPDAMVFLLNEYGRAFTPERFSKWFVKQCQRAGLPARVTASRFNRGSK
jgi:hypothetical protein